ncbi:MAG: hypothetical protein J6T92_06135 [Ottowia sp.]|nr:hypothetical protein [Ottowia sp.]
MNLHVSPQRIIGVLILCLGVAYGAALLVLAARQKAAFRADAGTLPQLAAIETGVYFCATLGISDYLMNTLLLRWKRLVEDRKLPGTLVTCGLTPSAVIAFALLQVDNPVALSTLLPCAAGIVLGSATGARIVSGMDGARIRRILFIALIGALIALIVRIVVARGAAGTATALTLPQLAFAVAVSFSWGAVNMIGVPMKPAGSAMFLLLGMSPIATLTMILVMGSIGPMGGGISIIKSGRYHQKPACAAVVFGSLGAILGVLFAISISATLLNILLVGVMLIAIVSLRR